MGAFLVFEAAEAAARRGRPAANRVVAVGSERRRRSPGSVEACLRDFFALLGPRLRGERLAIVSCASGAAGVTEEERRALATLAPEAPVIAVGDHVGYGAETQFPLGLAFADIILAGGLPPRIAAGDVDQIVVTCIGGWRGEGVGLIERAA
jgi:3-oxoacyl-[acyl-carrier-protein] synthase II